MFNKNLGMVDPFISDVADQYFANIIGTSFREDWSFLATLRALLFRRMPEGESLTLNIYRKDYGRGTISKHDPEPMMRAIFETEPDTISVIDYRTDDDGITALFNLVDNEETGYAKFSGSEEQKDIEDRVKNYANIRFYVNRERRYSVILVHNMDLRKYHFIQTFVIRALPWYFVGAPDCLDDLDKNLIKSFREKYAPDYEAAIAELGKLIDFRAAAIKMILGNFEKYAHEAEANGVKNNLNDLRRQIAENEQRYKQLIERINEQNIRLNGLLHIIDSCGDGSELIDYFNHNKSITPVSTYGTELKFIVKTFMEFFDEDMYAKYKKNGVIYQDTGVINAFFRSESNRRKLVDELFSEEPKFRVKLCGVYYINTAGSVRSEKQFTYPVDYADYLPNPHLQIFACLGNNKPSIQEALRNGNIIGAIEQCISATKGVNMTEINQTILPFIKWICNSNNKIIRLEDGRDVTAQEAVEWLDAQKKAQEEEKK